jgi:hypothetical protein
MSNFELKLALKTYSDREAWAFLQNQGPELLCSIRTLATTWKWHRSKVERFLKSLKAEMLIETGIKLGKTLIIMRQNRDAFRDSNEISVEQDNSMIEETDKKIARQNQDSFDDSFSDFPNFKEEKKKRSKKRKEEIKEKPLLKEGKKEKKINQFFINDSDNQNEIQVLKELLSRQPKHRPDSIVAEDVIDWAEKNLPKTIDLEWELEKFKDYHRSRPKKPPKDAVAAFRNWLRRATELQNVNLRRNNYEHYNNKTAKNNDLERFFAGGIRALDSISRSRLDW